MNCEQFERLIALKVEGDLPDKRRSKLTQHLSICGSCHRFAEEIRDSQSALHRYTAEDFDENLLAGIRQNVMTQIHQGPARLTYLEQIARCFGIFGIKKDYRRVVWAVGGAAAVIVIAGSFAVHLIYRSNGDVALNVSVPNIDRPVAVPIPPSAPKYGPVPVKDTPMPRHTKLESSIANQATFAQVVEIPVVPIFPTAPNVSETNNVSATRASEVASLDGRNIAELPAVATPDNMTRIEMRTGRQNIKIIWFAEKKTNAPPAAALFDGE